MVTERTAGGNGFARRSGGPANGAKNAAEDVADSRQVDWAARAGLAARGVVWIVIGILWLLLAQGAGQQNADQKGAFKELLSHSYGGFVVVLLIIGFVGYALWRLSEAAFGVVGDGKKTVPRLRSLGRAVIYFVLAGTAVSALMGSGTSQSSQQQSMSAKVMSNTGGRWLVAAVGLAVLVAGAILVYEGWKLKFMRYFEYVPGNVRKVVTHLGRVGTMGRGGVIGLSGALVIAAAWTADPEKARGLDGALRTLLQQPYGKVIAIVAAVALMAFGVYGLAEARWRRV